MAIRFPVAPSLVPIAGSNDHFQVRRIYCVGRNYAGHAREMGSDPTREPPFFFQKPTDAIQVVPAGGTLDHPYPPLTRNYHYEVEMVALLGRGGRDIDPADALACVFAYAVGLDMTRRDLQREMAEQKKPWEAGKAFDNAAVIGHAHPAERVGHRVGGRIQLRLNGELRQDSDLAQMSWNVAEQIARLSRSSELFPGDIIYTGTPENVGPVVVGDLIEASVERLDSLRVRIV